MNERTDRESSIGTNRERSGQSLRDVMTKNPATVTANDDIRQAARLMKENDCGSLPVVDGNRVRGMITDRDIVIRLIAEGRNPVDAKVSDAMTSEAHSVRENESLDRVFRLMSQKQVRRVPVVNDRDELIGIVAQADIALEGRNDERVGETVERISEPENRPGR